MDLRLQGKKALITGSTRGIGRATAERLVGEGCDVAICARHGAEVEEAVAALKGAGAKAVGRALDVRDRAALQGWVEDAARALSGLDILVANASGFAQGASPEAFRTGFEVDLMHTVNAVEAALPWLERSAAGAIVAIASISGVEDYGYGDVSYGAMKASLLFYVKSLARHLAPKGIRANVVSPGTTYFEGGFWHRAEREEPALFAEAMRENPMRRMGTPEEIANVAAFVASPMASFVTGANLVVDGSYTRRIQN